MMIWRAAAESNRRWRPLSPWTMAVRLMESGTGIRSQGLGLGIRDTEALPVGPMYLNCVSALCLCGWGVDLLLLVRECADVVTERCQHWQRADADFYRPTFEFLQPGLELVLILASAEQPIQLPRIDAQPGRLG